MDSTVLWGPWTGARTKSLVVCLPLPISARSLLSTMLKTREDPYNSANSEVAQEEGGQVSFQHILCGRQYTQQFPHSNTPMRWALFTSLQLSPLENRIPILQRSKESQGC